MYVRMYVCMYICMCVYVRTYVCVYVYMYVRNCKSSWVFWNNDQNVTKIYVEGNCDLLGYYAASSDSSLPTSRDNISVPNSRCKNQKRKLVTLLCGLCREGLGREQFSVSWWKPVELMLAYIITFNITSTTFLVNFNS